MRFACVRSTTLALRRWKHPVRINLGFEAVEERGPRVGGEITRIVTTVGDVRADAPDGGGTFGIERSGHGNTAFPCPVRNPARVAARTKAVGPELAIN